MYSENHNNNMYNYIKNLKKMSITYPWSTESFSFPSSEILLVFISNDPIFPDTKCCIFVKIGLTEIHWVEPLTSPLVPFDRDDETLSTIYI